MEDTLEEWRTELAEQRKELAEIRAWVSEDSEWAKKEGLKPIGESSIQILEDGIDDTRRFIARLEKLKREAEASLVRVKHLRDMMMHWLTELRSQN